MDEAKKSHRMKQWVRDLIYGVVIVLFSIGNIIYSKTLPAGSIKLRVAQAGFYLEMGCVAFGVLGIIVIIRAIWQKPEKFCQPLFANTGVVTIALLAAYLLVLKKIGFVISSFLLVFLLAIYYAWKMDKLSDKSKRVKRLTAYAIYAAIMVGFTYYLFAVVMTVVLPRFSLFGMY